MMPGMSVLRCLCASILALGVLAEAAIAAEPRSRQAAIEAARRDPTALVALIATLEIELGIESLAQAADRAEHAAVSQREQQELAQVMDLGNRLERRMGDRQLASLELARLEESLAAARNAATESGRRARELRQRLVDRAQRMVLLGEQRDALAGTPRASDPLSGEWLLQLLPTGQRGSMKLRLDGTLVQGSYGLDGGFSGSLRGTFVAGKVMLERIDSERGFDAVFEGRLLTDGRLAGAWRTTRLDGANYGGGDWTANRPGGESE